jgi:hypothetical protein
MSLTQILQEKTDKLKKDIDRLYDANSDNEGLQSLIKYLDALGVDIEDVDVVGTGSAGTAFISLRGNDRIIKYIPPNGWGSMIYWKLIKAIQDGNPIGFVTVYGYVTLPKLFNTQTAGGILVLERVDAQRGEEVINHLTDSVISMIEASLYNPEFNLETLKEYVETQAMEHDKDGQLMLTSMVEASEWLLENGLRYNDFHAGNVGYSKNDRVFKILDID